MSTIKQISVSCNKDCGAGCPLTAHIENNKIIKITNNKLAPKYFTGCSKGFNFAKVLYDKNRITAPLKRISNRGEGRFKEITWNEAFDTISSNLKKCKEEYGAESIITLGGSGSCRGAVHNTSILPRRFFRLLGNCTETFGNYSSQAVSYVMPYVFGTEQGGIDPLTLNDSRLIILWGANISDTRFSCQLENIILDQKRKGTPIIVIDPRKSKTVKTLGTEWIRVNPGTDIVLMSAVLYVLITSNLIDNDFIKKYSTGFEEYKDYITGVSDGIPKTPKWAENICGTDANTINKLAHIYGTTSPVALIPGLSIQRTIGGEEASRTAIILQTATGNLGKLGGTSGGRFWNGMPTPFSPALPIPKSKNNFKIPVYEWSDAILGNIGGKYPWDIKMIYNIGGNYLSQGSDIKKNIKAFEKVIFSVCHDSFLTPTAKFCDIVLPVTMWPEREDIISTTDNYLYYSNKAVNPPKNVKNDFDMFSEIADLLGFRDTFTENKTADEWVDYLLSVSEIKDIDKFKSTGIYEGKDQYRVAFSDFINSPKKYPLKTPSGLIEISSEKYKKETGFPSIPVCRYYEVPNKYPLRLVTPHTRFRINSSNSNIPFYIDKEDDSLWMNTEDARHRNILNGFIVQAYNELGKINIKVKVTNDIMQGTTCLNQGIWPKISGNLADGAANILSSTKPTMPSNGARTHSINIEVRKIDT
ncbi:MAG: molybdopterin-dependent oxidoreductase [bacterium]|nr:molybdopterin-dependent oxidoreductase [bacterium]